MQPNECLILFLKAPLPGRVKTRLAKSIGDKHALALYKHFVRDILETAQTSGRPLILYYYPAQAESDLVAWLGKNHTLTPQQGNSFGERMDNAFRREFDRGYDRAVLIGADIPHLSDAILNEAFSGLESADAVIGPARDGGYYLVGFNAKALCSAVFEGIPWGTAAVFEKTIRRCHQNSIHCHHLPFMRDVDDVYDLKAIMKKCRANQTVAPRTCHYLYHKLPYF